MKNIVVREAVESDVASWAELRQILWPAQRESHINELQSYFISRSNDIVKVFVAENDAGRVIGFIELNLRNFAEGSSARFVPYIEGWLVSESYQNRGIGKRLVSRAEAWARECGFNELASDTELKNDKSISIHRKLRFQEVERVVCFIKKLVTD